MCTGNVKGLLEVIMYSLHIVLCVDHPLSAFIGLQNHSSSLNGYIHVGMSDGSPC